MNFVALLENLSTRRKQNTIFATRTSSNTREEKKLSPAAAAGIEPKLTRVESGELCSAPFALVCFVRCFKGPPTRNALAKKSKQMWCWDKGELRTKQHKDN